MTAALRVAEAWADYTRAAAIYPETNARVRRVLASLLEQIPSALSVSSENTLRLLFPRSGLRINGEVAEQRAGSGVDWLRERLRRARLAGVVFSTEVTEHALRQFTKRLLSLVGARRPDEKFEDLWPGRYAGLVPIEYCFHGDFDPDAPAGEEESGLGGGGTRATSKDISETVELLAATPGVVQRLERLEERWKDARGERIRFDLLGRIVRLLPFEVRRTPEATIEVVERILEKLTERVPLGDEDGSRVPVDDRTMNRLLLLTCYRVFGREAVADADGNPTAIPDVPAVHEDGARTATGLRPGDEAFEDRPALLLEEVRALPSSAAAASAIADTIVSADVVGAYLHFVVSREDDAALPGIAATLPARLANPDADTLRVLRQYLEPGWGDSRRDAATGRERILRFLRAHGLLALVPKCGLVTADDVAREFPAWFPQWLDAQDLSRADGADAVARLVERIGVDVVLAKGREIATPDGLLRSDLAARIIASPSAQLWPLLVVLLEHGKSDHHAAIIEQLRAQRSSDPEARLLRLFENPASLPRGYAKSLLMVRAGAAPSAALRQRAVDILCTHLRTVKYEDPSDPQRIDVIAMLGRLGGPLAQRTLSELVSARRWLLLPREPRAVRVLARGMLRHDKTEEDTDV